MAKIDFTNVVLISGKRGTGKTYFLKYFLKQNYIGKGKVFIYDPLWQYDDLGVVVHQLKDISYFMLKDIKKAIVFQPLETEDTPEHFDAVVHYVYKKGNMVLAVDELNEYTTPNYIPPHFRAFVRRGRNYGCGFIGITHRPAYMSLNFLNFIDHWFIFQQDLERDLERIVEYIQRANPDYDEDFIAQMPDRHFIYFARDRETGKAQAIFSKPVKDTHTTKSSKVV